MATQKWNIILERFSNALGSEDEDFEDPDIKELKNFPIDNYVKYKDILKAMIDTPRYARDFFPWIFSSDVEFPDSYSDLIFDFQFDMGSDDFEDYVERSHMIVYIIDAFWGKMSLRLKRQLWAKTADISTDGLEDEWWYECRDIPLETMYWTFLKLESKYLPTKESVEERQSSAFESGSGIENMKDIFLI